MKYCKLVHSAIIGLSLLLFSGFTYPHHSIHNNHRLDPTIPVNITGGQVSGTYSQHHDVAIYKGIPYAKSPTGTLRWQDPKNVEPWQGVLKANNWGKSPIQNDPAPFEEWSQEFVNADTGLSEDALNLNIWAKTDHNKRKPVIVYVYGGGFNSGGSSCPVYDGENIAKQGAIFVSFNYRVGTMGFLAHPELTKEAKNGTSGNYGLMDQVKALQWVKQNIRQFGGNPNNVTLMGQSAGAESINDLMISPKAKGLFNKAAVLSINYYQRKLPSLAQKEAEGSKAFAGKSLSQMRQLPAQDVLNAKYKGRPNIDGKVVPGNYIDEVKKGNSMDIPVLAGYTQDDIEGELLSTDNLTKASYEKQVREKTGSYAEQFLKLYPATDSNVTKVANKLNVDDLLVKQNELARIRNKNYRSRTYNYLFSHVMPGPESDKWGAFHTSDVPYFLNNFSDLRKDYWTNKDFYLGQTMSRYLVNFAYTGQPNSFGVPAWPANRGNYEYMDLDSHSKMTRLSPAKIKLFQQLHNY